MNSYIWRPAIGSDVTAIVALAEANFQTEIDTIFTPEPITYSRNITLAIINQFYKPTSELFSVAVEPTGNLLAYTWAKSNDVAPWSDDPMVNVRMAHLDLRLTSRSRVTLLKDMIQLWEGFALLAQNPIVCSTTMRNDQQAFLKLHQRAGYDVRGSYAYKRLF